MAKQSLLLENDVGMGYYSVERAEMLPFVPSAARVFLELGCGAGAFGALLRRKVPGAHVTGVEIHDESAREARGRIDLVVDQPIEQAIDGIADQSIDCVICNDVLEHLVDPWQVLRQLRRVLHPGGAVVSSLPNVRHFPIFKEYFLGADWKYEEMGVLDRTHLRFFTRTSIERMFKECGYTISRSEGIFSQPLPWKASLLNRFLGGVLTDMQYERFATQAIMVG